MPTQEQAAATRTRLLDAAEDLMLSVGYVASPIEAICSAAGVTKGSFFHHFKSKEDLGKVLVQRSAARQHEHFAAACAGIADPLERVFALIEAAIAAARSPQMRGCLVGTFAQEISESHPELRDACRCSFAGFADTVAADLTEAKLRYAPQADFNAASLGAYFLSIVQGSMLLLRTTGDREAMAQNLTHLRQYLRSLYGR